MAKSPTNSLNETPWSFRATHPAELDASDRDVCDGGLARLLHSFNQRSPMSQDRFLRRFLPQRCYEHVFGSYFIPCDETAFFFWLLHDERQIILGMPEPVQIISLN